MSARSGITGPVSDTKRSGCRQTTLLESAKRTVIYLARHRQATGKGAQQHMREHPETGQSSSAPPLLTH